MFGEECKELFASAMSMYLLSTECSVLSWVWVLDIKTTTEEILSKLVDWVIWLLGANHVQAIGQENN